MKPESLYLLFKQSCQVKNFAKNQNICTFRQFISCLQNFGSGKTAWKVNKECLTSIEICLHSYLLESRWNHSQQQLISKLKVNSVQEACAKCFVVHILKFEILQTTWKNKTKSIKMLDWLMKNWKLRVWFHFILCNLQDFKF